MPRRSRSAARITPTATGSSRSSTRRPTRNGSSGTSAWSPTASRPPRSPSPSRASSRGMASGDGCSPPAWPGRSTRASRRSRRRCMSTTPPSSGSFGAWPARRSSDRSAAASARSSSTSPSSASRPSRPTRRTFEPGGRDRRHAHTGPGRAQACPGSRGAASCRPSTIRESAGDAMRLRRGPLFWGLLLIPLGGIPLLVRGGYIDAVGASPIAWRLWPLLLIGVGLADPARPRPSGACGDRHPRPGPRRRGRRSRSRPAVPGSAPSGRASGRHPRRITSPTMAFSIHPARSTSGWTAGRRPSDRRVGTAGR